jgi:Hypothetical protein (DUF2513)
MMRDMDLVRELLLAVEEDQLDDAYLTDADEKMYYHLELLTAQEWVEGITIVRSVDGLFSHGVHTPRLSWSGCEYLEAVREKSRWDRIKKFIAEKGSGLTVEAVKIAIPLVTQSLLGAQSQG